MNLRNQRAIALAGTALYGALLATSVLADPPKKTAPKPTAAQIAAGKKVYAANNCANCHAIGGEGGTTGPDLSDVGSDPKHTSKWFQTKVTNPKATNPNTGMPPFPDIKGKDLTNLAAYLGSLKKPAEKSK